MRAWAAEWGKKAYPVTFFTDAPKSVVVEVLSALESKWAAAEEQDETTEEMLGQGSCC
jgi:hypothetical protein